MISYAKFILENKVDTCQLAYPRLPVPSPYLKGSMNDTDTTTHVYGDNGVCVCVCI